MHAIDEFYILMGGKVDFKIDKAGVFSRVEGFSKSRMFLI